MKNHGFPLVLLLTPAFSDLALAQKDTEFWFVAPEIAQAANTLDRPVAFRFSTYDDPATVTVSQPANPAFPVQTISMPGNSSGILQFPPFFDLVENSPPNQKLNKGFLIQSTSPVTAYYEIIGQVPNNPEIFSLKGKNALGTDFFVPFQNITDNSSAYSPLPHAAFDIVATEDTTLVTITPTQAIVGHPANVPFSITLNRGETYSAEAASQAAAGHPTGSKVVADKPIAVTIKDDLLEGGPLFGGFCRDVMGDQLVPTEKVGTKYVVRKGFLNGNERAFVVATAANTQVNMDGILQGIINAGQTLGLAVGPGSHFIQSTAPVYVLQMSGINCEVAGEILPDLDCSGSSEVRFVRSTFQEFYLLLATKKGNEGGFALNGNAGLIPASSFQIVPGSNGEYVSALLSFSSSTIVPGQSSVVENSLGLFQMGFLDGGLNTGCRLGFFSDFGNQVNVKDTVQFCEGDSIQAHGLTISAEGTFYATVTNAQGCDTLFEITAAHLTTISDYRQLYFCPGSSVTLNGNTYTQPGTVIDTIPSASGGCDTIVTYSLALLPQPTHFETIQFCPGSSVTINGATYDQPGTIIDTIPSASAGCDTVAIYQLEHTSLIPAQQTIEFCPGDAVTLGGTTYTQPATVLDTISSTSGCDTLLTVKLKYAELPQTAREIVLCEGESVVIGATAYSSPAVVADTIPSFSGGCDTVRTTTIFVEDAALPFLPADSVICPGGVVTLSSPFAATVWNGTTTATTFEVTAPGLVVASAFDANGCPRLDSILFKTCCSEQGIYVPNIFSPNGDNTNDEFCAFATERCTQYTLRVFDRWGEQVFEALTPGKCWDGTFRGKAMPPGVYVWFIEIFSQASQKGEILHGDVTLLR